MAHRFDCSEICFINAVHVAIRVNDVIVVVSSSQSPTEGVVNQTELCQGQKRETSSKRRSEIWMYNLWTESWRDCILPQGKKFPFTSDQRSVAIDSDIFMFGGHDSKSDLWKLTRRTGDVFDWNIIGIEDLKRPSPRVSHCMWQHGNKMWVYGGFGVPPADGYLNDHGDFTRSVDALGCNNQLLSFDPTTETWENMACSGDLPSLGRNKKSAIIKDTVYMYKFEYSVDECVNEFHELNMYSHIWTQIEYKGSRLLL